MNLEQEGAQIICSVESVLKDKGIDMKVKNRHWYNLGEKYVRASFLVKVCHHSAILLFGFNSLNFSAHTTVD